MMSLAPNTIRRITKIEWRTMDNRAVLFIGGAEVVPYRGGRLEANATIAPIITLIEAATGYKFAKRSETEWERTEEQLYAH